MEKLQTIFLYIFPLSSLLSTFIVVLCLNISGKETEVENMLENTPDKTGLVSTFPRGWNRQKKQKLQLISENNMIPVSGGCGAGVVYVVMLCVTI